MSRICLMPIALLLLATSGLAQVEPPPVIGEIAEPPVVVREKTVYVPYPKRKDGFEKVKEIATSLGKETTIIFLFKNKNGVQLNIRKSIEVTI